MAKKFRGQNWSEIDKALDKGLARFIIPLSQSSALPTWWTPAGWPQAGLSPKTPIACGAGERWP